MIKEVLKNPVLANYIKGDCEENGISASISPLINNEDLVVICVDCFYNNEIHNPPPSPDCLIIIRCNDGYYRMFIVELKDIRSKDGFEITNVTNKFITCLEDFMSNRFSAVFYDNIERVKSIKLLFITDPYNFLDHPEKQLKMKGHRLDFLMAQRIPKFFGMHLYIEHKLPNPTINPC